MNYKLYLKRVGSAVLGLFCLLSFPAVSFAGGSLEGQNKGDTNTWTSVNLQDWEELDFIPFRVAFSANSSGSQTISLDFSHLSGSIPGFEDMYSFTNYTTNVTIVSGPTLTMNVSGDWHYNLTVNIADNNPAEVRFFARVAAGSHLNGGSSLHLNSNFGNVQIHKIGPGPAIPDLAIVKKGPAVVAQNGIIVYTMTYTNKADTNSIGVQISDFFPNLLQVVTNTLPPNAHVVGNNIFFDLTNVATHASGQVSFQALVPLATPIGQVISNFSQILSSENDANSADNQSSWLTTVTSGCTAPSVNTPPNDQAVCPGTSANFSVTANGTGLSYQWYKGVGQLNGQTNTTLTLNNVTAADAAVYSVVVAGLCGTPVTNSATLTVNTNAFVAIPPSNATNCPGATANFSVSASGTGLSYQWYKGVSALLNQTNSTLTLNNVSSGDAGTYNVVVSGLCGTPITNSATLVVNTNAFVATTPSNTTNCPGTTASFSVNASGTGLSYQWYKGVNALVNQTNSTLTLNNVNSGDAGSYSVVVGGVCGSPITNSATLVVNTNAFVATAPSNSTNCPGTTANFGVSASGTGLSYQWFKGVNALPNQTNSSLTLNNVSFGDAGSYSVVVSGVCGTAITNSATLVVNTNAFVATTPSNSTNCPGTTANFSVSASGTGLSYQWFKGVNALANQTNSSLALNNVSFSDAGSYSVVVSGTCGGSVTNGATLVVNTNVMVGTAPSNATNCPGTTANFSVSASGTGINYQWYKGVTLLGETSGTLTLNNVTSADAGTYSVVVSGVCGTPITNSATLVVNTNAFVATAPSNSTNCPGTTASFSVSAAGTGLSYQWYKGANLLGSETGSTLTLNSVTATDAGTYSVVVSGVCGTPITNSATLVVNTNAFVATTPSNSTNCPGTTATFSLGANGTGLNYQWYKGATLLGDTSSTLTLNNVTAVDAGTYSVVVSGVCGTPITNSATLVVNTNAFVATAPSNSTNCPGTTASFSVSAAGTGLSYQWYKGANLLGSETGSTLTLNGVTALDAGTYSVVVSGVCGMPVTNGATLVVNTNAFVATAPSNNTNCPGTTANFSVSASGTGLGYQWYKGVNALANQTNSTLSLSSVTATDAGIYSVVVSGVCGTPVTNSATLVVNTNAFVSTAPGNTTNCPGTTANFSVSASGTGLMYQWYKGVNALVNQTNSTLALSGVTSTDAGIYSVVISGVCGTPVTNSATLVVNTNAFVAAALSNTTNCPGTTANFGVSASGTGLSYQWYKGANALLNQTNSSLTLNNVSSSDAGSYSIVVSGVCGTPVTNSATLVVNTNAFVATALSNSTNCPGTTAAFSLGASGTGLNYQWYKGATLLGEPSSTLTLNNVTAADAGTYSVVVSGVCGAPITNSATLVVNTNAFVSTVPSNTTNCPGTAANFSVTAGGTALTYQWFKGANALANQTNGTLTLNNVSFSDAGSYSVVVSGVCGAPITNSATLAVNTNAFVATAPSNTTNCPGATANFSVSASGTGLSYQWYKGVNALANQTNSSLALNNVSSTDAGAYSVVVGGVCGTTVTNSATLVVNTNVFVSTAPSNTTNCPGTTANFSVSAGGTGLGYQWYKGVNALVNQTNSSLALNNVSSTDAGTYSVVASGVCGTPVTNSATLVVNTNAFVATAPSNTTNCPGTTANFSLSATGTGLSYQWYKGVNTLANQTNSSLALNNVISTDAGTYSVVVSGVCGTPITNSATLVVNTNAFVTTAPSNGTNCPGTTANFSVSAGGTGLSYQWYKGVNALVNQTNNGLTLNNVSSADAGTYSVVVGGVCGTSITNSATLVVNTNAFVATVPSNSTNCPGTTANFSVTASGTGLNYQWYKGVNALVNQTNNALTLNNVSASDGGTYSVVVGGVCGTSITNSATLVVNTNAFVATAPSNSTNCPGTTANFSVSASGTGLSYQWYKGVNALVNQTNSTLTRNNVSSGDAGSYSVVVSGVCGAPITNSATLVVNTNVFVATAPSNTTNCPGTTANFSVSASGTGLSYQWYKGVSALPNQTNSTLTLSNVSSGDAGTYNVVVSGLCGAPITNSATLVVNTNGFVSTAPSNATNCPGTTANFSVSASGTGLSYQWYKGVNALINQTNSTLALNSVSASDAGVYRVVVSGVCGVPVTNSATLVVNTNVFVATAPSNTTNCPGTTANFSVSASGTGLNYQWYKGVNALVNQTNSSLSLNSVSFGDAGSYTVVVGGVCGTAITNSATLVVNTNAFVATAPSNTTNCPGTTANFSVSATGTGLSYQWYKGVNALANQTNSTLALNNVTGANAGSYSVVVSGVCGALITNSATLVVNTNAFVSTAPSNATNCPGTTANFSVTASGTGLSYQWYKGVNALSNQTNSTLTLNSVSSSDAGSYTVVVGGVCGAPVTNSATLVVNTNAFVATAPSNATNCPGTTANFSVSANGTGLSYQWYKGVNALANQTNSALTLNNVTAANAGSYSVVVSGVCGASITNSATLVVNTNAFVSTAPSNATNCPGTTANFSVSAGGTGLSYQWYKGVNALANQTNSSLTLNNVTAANAGSYSVVVSGVCGASITNSATLVVNTNVSVATAPSNATNCPGTTANFSVGASGTGLDYQWYKGVNALPSQTNSTLTLSGVTSTDAGIYSVVVSGVCGTSATNSATLVVNTNASVATSPSNTTNCPGTTANFSVSASGTGLNYQWYKGVNALVNQTNSTLTLNNVSSGDAGAYSVVVSGVCGAPITNSATLVVNTNAFVATAPSNSTNCPGTTANFNVSATGTGLSYQWYKGVNALVNQTNNSLTLNNVSSADAGTYSVVVSGVCGTSITNSAALVVNTNAFVATTPSNSTNCPGTTANFSVSASGTGLNYQWYKGVNALPNQTNSTLSLNSVSFGDAGIYSVVVSGVCGAPITNSATLVVNTNAFVATAPNNTTNCPGTTANFSVSAIGTGLNYQWYKGVNALVNQTNSTLTLNNVSSGDAGTYRVVVSGVCGTPITNSATLVVNVNVSVGTAPSSTTNCPGTTANFSVSASGTGLSYQWYNGANALANQTNSTLTLNSVSATDAGVYSVVVSGVCGSPITNSATLVVNTNVFVVTAPGNTTNCPGTTANFSVNAIGTGLSYQWYKGANLLGGQTGSTLTLNSVSAGDAGTYSVVVSGVCGTPITNSAVLVVNQIVSVAPLSSLTNNIGTSVTFTAVASGTGPFGYQWYKGANALSGQTNSTLTLNNLQPSDAGAYSVRVTGACNGGEGQGAVTGVVLTINLPPVVAIMYPTNGSVYVEPAMFTIMAGASDPDGTVTNVEFFTSTNGVDFVLLGETNGTPYLTIASNLPAGHYTLVARATDDLGATGVSAPVTVDVVPPQPPTVTVTGNMTLNLQDGNLWLTNVVCNPVYSYSMAVRVYIHGITNSSIKLVNATGTTNGLPYVDSPAAITPGSCWTNVIKFYDQFGIVFNPTLTVELVPVPNAAGDPDGIPAGMIPPKMLRNGTVLIEFATTPNKTYYVQYSSDMVQWKTSYPAVTGTGQHLQWIDSGPPVTESLPAANQSRFYRVFQASN